MNVLIVFAHPNPKSFNKATVNYVHAEFESRGDVVRVKDLYAEKFNPVLDEAQLAMQSEGKVPKDVIEEQAIIDWADTIVIIYPLWWSGRPAILKGWFDRVLTNGFAFGFENGELRGFLSDKRALIIITAGGKREEIGASDEELVKNTADSLTFCGISGIKQQVFYSVPEVNDAVRQQMLLDIKNVVKEF
jgi:NAD(P)H dehydrogenase (quinone)